MRNLILSVVLGLIPTACQSAGGHYETVYVKVCKHVPAQTETVLVVKGTIAKDGYEATAKPKPVFTPKSKYVCTMEPKSVYRKNPNK